MTTTQPHPTSPSALDAGVRRVVRSSGVRANGPRAPRVGTHRPHDAASPAVPSRERRLGRDERKSWRTSTAPAALSVAMLTALATALALGLREAAELAISWLAG